MKQKKPKPLPKFKSLEEEANFWDTHDITDYWGDWEEVELVFIPREKKETSITIRLESEHRSRLEHLAQKNHLSLSSIARAFLIDRIISETSSKSK